jgi:hypothetical protein
MYIVFMYSAPYNGQILIKLELSWQILEKHWKIKLNENSSSGSRVVSRGRTHRHEEVQNRLSQFCEHA